MTHNRAVTEYKIRAGGYTATITAQAGALRELRHRGRDLIVPFPAGGPIPDYRGIIAAPWPNRIPDGRYTFEGADTRSRSTNPNAAAPCTGWSSPWTGPWSRTTSRR